MSKGNAREITIGLRYGKLELIKNLGRNENKQRMVRIKCDCGTEMDIPFSRYIPSGRMSCGCTRSKRKGEGFEFRATTSHSREYETGLGRNSYIGYRHSPLAPILEALGRSYIPIGSEESYLPVNESEMTPERFLMLDILETAILDMCHTRRGTVPSGMRKEKGFWEMVTAADEWVMSDEDCAMSFVQVCSFLGLDPGYIRRGAINLANEFANAAR